jgi:hypothetical protein
MLTWCIATSLPGHLLLLEATLPVDGALPSMATNLNADTYIAAHTRKSTTKQHHATVKGPLSRTHCPSCAVNNTPGLVPAGGPFLHADNEWAYFNLGKFLDSIPGLAQTVSSYILLGSSGSLRARTQVALLLTLLLAVPCDLTGRHDQCMRQHTLLQTSQLRLPAC